MQIYIYDAKLQRDNITTKWLRNALANIYFYHGTVVKVYVNNINSNLHLHYKKINKK